MLLSYSLNPLTNGSSAPNSKIKKEKKDMKECYCFPFLRISVVATAIAMMMATAATMTYVVTSELVTMVAGIVVVVVDATIPEVISADELQ